MEVQPTYRPIIVNKHNKIYCFIALIFLCLNVQMLRAQDIHFSQFNATPTYLNPANSGLFDGDYRIMGTYRNQYKNITVGYNSINMGIDTRFKIKKQLIGVGLLINTDKAGDSRYGGNRLAIALSYIKQITKDSTQFIAFGFQPGIASRGLNSNALTFDTQYDGDVYNQQQASGESFDKTNFMFLDMALGITWYMKKSKRNSAIVGIGYQHFSKLKKTFITGNSVTLSSALNLHGSVTKQLNSTLDIIPEVLYSHQNKFNEVVAGARLKYWLGSNGVSDRAIYAGLYYRVADAFITSVAMDYNNFTVGLSYDFTLSPLKTANRVRGGTEVSIIYIFRKPPPFTINKKGCPAWM